MLIRLAGFVQESIVDGPGFRLAVFTQGCPHNCKDCHNPQTHDFAGGWMADTADIISMMDSNPLLDGITLTGGEPFCQPEACKELADAAHQRGLSVWCYTGYTWKQLKEQRLRGRAGLLESVDVLVDGPYIEALRTLDLPWRGSKNQKIIDVQRSLGYGRAVEWRGADG